MAFCVNCGTKIEEGIKFCPSCGTQVGVAGVSISQEKAVNFIQPQPVVLPAAPPIQSAIMADEMYCFSCGAVIKKAAAICPKCGVNQSMRSRTTAINVYCSSCGKTINKEAVICPFCGVSQGAAASWIKDKRGPAIASLVLGINSLWAWFLPIAGFPVAIIGLLMGIVGRKSTMKKLAMAGLILSIIGLVATIVNSAIGAYQGAKQGQLIGTWVFEGDENFYFTFFPDNTLVGRIFYSDFRATYDSSYIYWEPDRYRYELIDGKLYFYHMISELPTFIYVKRE